VGRNLLWISIRKNTTGNVIHTALPVGLYYPQNKKIIFSTFHNGFFGGSEQ